MVAIGCGHRTTTLPPSIGAGISQPSCGALLSGTEDIEKEGCESTEVGVQLVSEEGKVEVCEVFAELLLFEAMSEC